MTVSLFKSPEHFSVFRLILIMLLTGWSPLFLLFPTLQVHWPIFWGLFQVHELQLESPSPLCSIVFFFFSSLAMSTYWSLFPLSFNFTLQTTRMAKSTNQQVLSSNILHQSNISFFYLHAFSINLSWFKKSKPKFVYTHTHTHTYMHTHIYTYTHTHTYIYIYIYMHTHIYTYMHIYLYTYIYIHTHIYAHTYAHMYTHTHICILM